MRPSPQRTALRLALLYVAISGVYILFSDRLLASLTQELRLLTGLQTLKGWAFVVSSGVLLYVLVHRALRRAADSDVQVEQVATARKRAETALAEEHNLLRTLIDNLPDYIFIKDTQSRFVMINRAQADLLGVRSPEEAVGKSDLDFLPADVALQYRADEERVVQTGEPLLHQEERGPTRTAGEVHWHLTTKVPLRDAEGQVVGLVGISRNITGVKRAEEALLRRTHQLDAIRTVSAEITRELQLTALLDLVTRRAAELIGVRSGTLYLWDEAQQTLTAKAWVGPWVPTGSRVRRLDEGVAGAVAARRAGMIVNDYRSSPVATAETLGRPGVTAVIGEPLIYRDRLAGVIAFDNQGVDRRFTPDDGEILNLLAAQAAIAVENARLFSELNHSYAHLRRAQDELIRSEKLRAMGQMSAGVAHDLNNTLGAILSQVELLQSYKTDATLRESLGILEMAATDGAQVVRRLQGFARQQPASELMPCDLAHLVAEALEISRPRWRDEVQRRGYLIEVHTALEGLPPILGHASEIREALTNLILNAVDAMPSGGSLTISGRQTIADPAQTGPADAGVPTDGVPMVELCIADTGVGMTAEVRQRAFEPFFTTKGGHGTGLGLSMVYGIVERHGGRIEIASTPGQGTTFTLRLRSVSVELPATPSPQPQRRPPRRILVIDDDARVRQAVAGLLRSAGHHVVEAEGGREGLMCFAPEMFDLVLTDLGMPEVNGWDVAAAVKARHAAFPVILFTGWGDEHTGGGNGRGLADRILRKPVRLKELLQAIAELTPDA
jgi:PAS domain S-box-containing protein